jgi:hypothetical protein
MEFFLPQQSKNRPVRQRSPLLLSLLVAAIGFGYTQGAAAECLRGDCINGFGTFLWPSGSRYDGDFHNGIRHGAGSYLFADGSLYVGEYLNGVRHVTGQNHLNVCSLHC